jgi:enterochelin esterase-like enzyme
MSAKKGIEGAAKILLLSGLWLLGCQPAASNIPQAESKPACNEVGTIEQGSIDEASRGYAYSYFIYLPPCYESEREQRYPVLYLLPGLGSGPGSWFAAGANETADDMILSGKVPPFIIVATEEISADPLAEIIYLDLIPTIESSYRVTPGRRYRSVGGGSLGSVGAYRLAFQYPGDFASAGMFGGGLINGEEPRVTGWLNAMAKEEQPRLFLNTGEQDPLMLERAQVMIDLLDEKQIEHTEVFTPGEHTYGYWISNFPTYFEWLAQDWN